MDIFVEQKYCDHSKKKGFNKSADDKNRYTRISRLNNRPGKKLVYIFDLTFLTWP